MLRIRDVYPGSRILIFVHPGSRSPDPKTATKERSEKNLLSYLFCSHKNHKIENYINFELVKKKIWANLQRFIELSTQKIVIKLSKYGFSIRDPGKPIPDPGVKMAPDPDPQHC